jgi:protoheme IX farnesyltransferase
MTTAVKGFPVRAPIGAVSAYVALTKPRIIELLLVTTVPSMLLAAHGFPSVGLLLAVLFGGAAAAGSANAYNSFLDRDIDAVMGRTARRPLNARAVSPRNAFIFATVLGVGAVGEMWLTANLLAAALTVAAILIYVVGYTLLLKRRTASNIVWGGTAGCMPTLIGWAAVTGRLSAAPFVLFAIVFFWTPPHFWALAMRFRADYAAAAVPMLPVVVSAEVVVARMRRYTWLTVAASLLLWPVASTGPVYVAAAVVLGALFLREVDRLGRDVRSGATVRPMRLFHWSITYLTLLFVSLAVDTLLPIA